MPGRQASRGGVVDGDEGQGPVRRVGPDVDDGRPRPRRPGAEFAPDAADHAVEAFRGGPGESDERVDLAGPALLAGVAERAAHHALMMGDRPVQVDGDTHAALAHRPQNTSPADRWRELPIQMRSPALDPTPPDGPRLAQIVKTLPADGPRGPC